MPRIPAEDREEAVRTDFGVRLRSDPRARRYAHEMSLKISKDWIRQAFDSEIDEIVPTKIQSRIGFQRTLRIPDNGKTHPLPPGLGKFPLRHVDDDETQGNVTLPPWRKILTKSVDSNGGISRF